jgi:hypothetical protein
MTIFETDSRQAFSAGIIAIIVCAGAAVALLAAAFWLPVTLLTFFLGAGGIGLLALVGYLGFKLYELLNLSYAVDRNALVIRAGAARHIVPMAEVQRLIRGNAISEATVQRLPLNGWWVGTGRHEKIGPIRFFATAPLAEQYVLVTSQGSLGISPYDAELFEQTFEAQLDLKPTQKVTATTLVPPLLDASLWKDRAALSLLILGLAINLLTFGISLGRYPAVPSQLVLHFNAAGIADRFGSTAQLFAPPVIALLLFIINAILGIIAYRKGEPMASYLVWGGNLAVQVAFLGAAITIGFTSGLA